MAVTSPPPGLGGATAAVEELPGSRDTAAAAHAQVGSNGGTAAGDQGAEDLPEAVLRVIDKRVSEKWEEMWRRGTQAINQLQRKNLELEKQVKTFKDRQLCLETENDKLKHVVANLAGRFHALGVAFQGSPAPPNSATPPGASSLTPQQQLTPPGAPPMTPQQLDASPMPGPQGIALMHGLGGAASTGPGLGASLPEVPTFPLLGPSPASPAQPLSLVEGLGLSSSTPPQTRTPVALAQQLTPGRAPEAAAAGVSPFAAVPMPVGSPAPAKPGPPGSFFITLRKADGVDLGLDVMAQDQVLLVCDVVPDGAVEAWNRQCLNRQSMDRHGVDHAQERMIHVGDKIITVNSVGQDTLRMMEECRGSQLLKLCLLRGDRTGGADTGGAVAATPPREDAHGATGASTLRADAEVFVPRGDTATEDASDPASEQAAAVEETASSGSAADGPVQRV